MKSFSIRLQILLIAMLPVVLIDIFLTSVYINNSIDQAQELLKSKGEIIAKQISSASEFYLFSGNNEQIQHLLDQSINSNDIIYSAVYNQPGELIAEARGRGYSAQNSPMYFYYRQAIQSQSLGSSDIFETDSDSDQSQMQVLGWVHLYISKQKLEQSKIDIYTEGLMFFIIMLVVAMILTAIISNRITRPVFSLLDHLKKIEKGDLGQVIKDIKNNEIGEVQRGFNSMSQSLLANRIQLDQKIETATHELRGAISDLEYKNRELAIAMDQAQRANQVKSQFLANISHEIRTPINGIKGFINLLSASGLDQNQKRYADIISQSTLDLSSIINELLDFSKIESGKVDIVENEFDFYELLETTRDGLISASMEKNIDLHLTIYSDTPQKLIGDQFRLKQILINLIGNAIKFTDQGYVNITVMLQDEDENHILVDFRIQDSGIGISEQDQALLFQAFKQIESDTNRRYSGTGLGLVIAQNLAHLMGGKIELQSEPDSGSVFTLTLPFKPALEAQPGENPFSNQTAMIYSFNSLCQHEIQSLFNRVGFITETHIIDHQTDILQLRNQLLKNLDYLNLIVFDLRHSSIHPNELFDHQLREHSRIAVMHYDLSLIDSASYKDYEFISIINSCNKLRRLLALQTLDKIAQPANDIFKPALNPGKILIVDDNPINLTLASELASMWGHTPFEASNAHEAMQLFNDEEFDLILLDIQMPEIDGVELMQMMRKQRPDLETPIAAITANAVETEKDRLIKLGFNAYLSKPVEEQKLRDLLDKKEILDSGNVKEGIDRLNLNDQSIDFELSLKLSANNEQLVMDMFDLLKQGIPEYQQQLHQAIEARSLGKLAYIIHKLQGVICYTGLPRLRKLLSRYEELKHSGPEDTFKVCEEIIDELNAIDYSLEPFISCNNCK